MGDASILLAPRAFVDLDRRRGDRRPPTITGAMVVSRSSVRG